MISLVNPLIVHCLTSSSLLSASSAPLRLCVEPHELPLPRAAQPPHYLGQQPQHILNLLAGVVPADREAQAASDRLLRDADRAQDVARLGRAGGAGRAARRGDAFQVE